MMDIEYADGAGGIDIYVREDITGAGTVQLVAQRLVCWERTGTGPRQTISYRSSHPRPHFRVPAGSCIGGRQPLTLTPDGPEIRCAPLGEPPTLVWARADGVGGIDVATCQELPPPTDLIQTNPSTTPDEIDVAWTPPAAYAPDGYVLRVRKHNPDVDPEPWTRVDLRGGETQYAHTGLTPNSAYEFQVRATSSGKMSAMATATFTTGAAAPASTTRNNPAPRKSGRS